MIIDSEELKEMIYKHLNDKEGYGDIYKVFDFIEYLESKEGRDN